MGFIGSVFLMFFQSYFAHLQAALCNAGAIEYVVRSLARDASEARHAVSLLMELSKEELSRERISKVQGCILLLVTIMNSEAVPSAANAKEILELLANGDDNVVLMANANYFKPLVKSLNEGSLKPPHLSV